MRLIYVLEEDEATGAALVDHLSPYGYRVQCFQTAGDFRAALWQQAPVAALVTLPPASDGPVSVLIGELACEGLFPFLLMSERQDFDARLQAVRAGAKGFVAKPMDVPSLVDQLDALTETAPPQPFRIILVDDDPIMGQLYELALRKAGMEVVKLSDPTQAIAAIHDHDPDLLITDFNMPQCTGLELASVIRGHSDLAALPIVFLTADERTGVRRSAVNFGGDAFLTKPINLPELVETVRARARRARQLRSKMIRDSLTGALNHAMIKELLTGEMARVQRFQTTACFVMIDIDHFKQVNDSYGHPAGDQVIKALARLLQQQLRRTDHIGRYGGEEFAVIMPRTDVADAMQRVEDLRARFAAIPHRAGNATFTTTFSAGIAVSGTGYDATMSEAADAALYAAKRAGRNRVHLAAPLG